MRSNIQSPLVLKPKWLIRVSQTGGLRYCWALRGSQSHAPTPTIVWIRHSFNGPIYVTLSRDADAEISQWIFPLIALHVSANEVTKRIGPAFERTPTTRSH